MKVAVIILNYNSAVDCAKCISFLKRQENVDLEIIIVDNHSQPKEVESIKVFCKAENCTLLLNEQNKGYSAGNNVGLRYAAGKGYQYVLIANPDMEFPQTDYISQLVNRMEKDSRIVVAGTDIIGTDGIHQNPMKPEGNWTESFGWIKDILQRKKSVDAYHFIDQYDKSHYCHKLGGCCLMVRLSFMQRIGFFDGYPFLYCEEAILSRQVESKGQKMYYIADLQAVHRHIRSEKGNPVKRFKEWRRSRFYFIDHYSGDSLGGRLIAKCSIGGYILLMIVRSRIQQLKNGM